MTNTNRIIINTLAQNFRTILNIMMSLYSTRLVLDALGKSEYGIYMLVGGVVSLLSYITISMIITTQRHLSYCYGEGNSNKAKDIFQNSYLLHCTIGCVISIIFLSLTPLLFDNHFLNIDVSLLEEAKYVYYLVILSALLTFIVAPFRAMLTVHENIIYISIIDVLDGALKLGLVFILFCVDNYRLTLYAAIMTSIMIFHFCALAFYCKFHYHNECSLVPHIRAFNKTIQRQLIGFATWTLYGIMCIFLRAQGLAIAFNKLFGIIANTAYGIANQIFNSIQVLSQAILNAITPQIIKAEGAHDRKRMIYLSLQACKYCFLLLAVVAIPLIFEMEQVLTLWLGNVPEYTVVLCRTLLVASLIDQITIGLNTSIQAMGKIRNYTLCLYTIKVLTIPLFWIAVKTGFSIEYAMIIYIAIEFIVAAIRLPYITRKTELTIKHFLNKVLFRILLPCTAMVLMCCFICQFPSFMFRFLFTGIMSASAGIITTWLCGLDHEEKRYIMSVIKQKRLTKE